MHRWSCLSTGRLLLAGAIAFLLPGLAAAQPTTTRVSVGPGGTQANNRQRRSASRRSAPMAAGWRSSSFASNLVAGDTNGLLDVFVHDQQTKTTARVSVGPGGVQGNGSSGNPTISADGRWVAFGSFAGNLVAGDTNGLQDVFVHDRQTGTTTRVSVGPGARRAMATARLRRSAPTAAGWRSIPRPAIWWRATPMACIDVFVHDRQTGTTTRVSVGPGGAQANGAQLAAVDQRRRSLGGVQFRCQQPGGGRHERARGTCSCTTGRRARRRG